MRPAERRRAARRAKRAGLLTVATLGAALGCQRGGDGAYLGNTDRGEKDPATLYINGIGEPEHLDPAKSADTLSAQYIRQMFEGLTTYGPSDLTPVQGVARAWERSDDGRVYRFHLRPEARWSDGQPVRSRDFDHAWKRALWPQTASRAAPELYPLKNAELFHGGRLKVARADLEVRASPGGPPSGVTLERGAAVVVLERPKADRGGKAEVLVARHLDRPRFAPRRAAPAPARAPLGYVAEEDLWADDGLIGVRATDDLTLEVELERPTPYFLDLTCRPAYAPARRDVIEALARRGEEDLWVRPEHIVVNGPYTLESWKFRYEITMKQNPHYWAKDALRIRRIVWLHAGSSWSAMNLYRTAELDMFGANASPAPEHAKLVEGSSDARRFPLLMVYWYELNTRAPPLDDVRVRHALDLAVDKRTLVERVVSGGALPATHYVPETTGSGYAELLAAERAAGADPFSGRGHDPARARALLAEAGYEVVNEAGALRAKGFPPLEVLYNTGDDGHQRVAVALQDMWRQHLGVAVTLRAEEWKVLLNSMQERQFQVLRYGWVADYNHPLTFLETFRSGSPSSFTGWSDPELDALLDRAAAAVDEREGMRLYREAEQRALAGMSRIPLYFAAGSTLIKPWVKGYRGNGGVEMIRWLWIDPSWRDNRGDEPAGLPLAMPPPGRLAAP